MTFWYLISSHPVLSLLGYAAVVFVAIYTANLLWAQRYWPWFATLLSIVYTGVISFLVALFVLTLLFGVHDPLMYKGGWNSPVSDVKFIAWAVLIWVSALPFFVLVHLDLFRRHTRGIGKFGEVE